MSSTPEPKVKRNKKCVTCNGDRRITSNPQRGVDPLVYERDPFCSAVCAKKYYGVVDSSSVVSANPSKHRGPGIRIRRSKHG